MTVSGPMGLPLQTTSEISDHSLVITQGSCEACVQVTLRLRGSTWLGGDKASVKAKFPWQMQIRGDMTMRVGGGLGARTLVVEPVTAWQVAAKLEGMPALIRMTAEGSMRAMVLEQLKQAGLTRPLRVLTLPSGLPVDVKGVGVRVQNGLVVELGLGMGTTDPLLAVEVAEGWALTMPEATMSHLVQAWLLSRPVEAGYAVALKRATVQDGTLDFEVRVWRAVKREAWRDFQIDLLLKVAESGNIELAPRVVSTLESKGPWANVGAWLAGKKAIEKGIASQLHQVIPAKIERKMGQLCGEIHADSIVLKNSIIVVQGGGALATPTKKSP